jgi:ABC-type sulfate transport system permease component
MNDAFSNMGMKSTNMLKNMGTFLFAFVGIILIIVFLIVIRKLMLRRPLTTKIYNAIHAKIFFNSILRSMLTSFLAMNLSTMISI